MHRVVRAEDSWDPMKGDRSRFRRSLLNAMTALSALVVFGSVSYRFLEHWTWVQSFYFCVNMLTTVGFGDLVPSNDGTRLFTALYMIAGVAIAAASLTVVGTNYFEFIERRTRRERWRLRRMRTNSSEQRADEEIVRK